MFSYHAYFQYINNFHLTIAQNVISFVFVSDKRVFSDSIAIIRSALGTGFEFCGGALKTSGIYTESDNALN